MRLLPEQHLRRQSEIKAVREKGRRLDCGVFTLWWLERPADNSAASAPCPAHPRVCVVASIAAVGKSVSRARAKRRLRELFRRNQEHLAPNIDLLLLARGSLNRARFPDLEKRFLQACSHLPRPSDD